ncbi:hypothetical protein [Shimia ponticola]|uniref:hypothetical protein n=1 Tax=Shimia ponticola TaxID=2582893 RepID=UPI0011BF4402|nr:hypothetical protein [Shimia ponticola]
MADHSYLSNGRAAKWRPLRPDEADLAAGFGGLAWIALWFFCVAAFELRVAVTHDLPLPSLLFTGLTVIAAIGLLAKAWWGFALALLMAARQVFGVVYLIASGGVEVPFLAAAYGVGNAVIGAVTIIYLMEGARPNAVFFGRVRKEAVR